MNRYTERVRQPYPVSLHLLAIAPLALLLCLFWGLFGPEREIITFFAQYRPAHPKTTAWLKLYTNVGNALFYPLYAVLLWQGIRKKKPELTRFALAYVLAQLIVSLALGHILKFSVGRPRPMTGGPFTFFALDPAHHSFPSGHTSEITGAALPLVQRWKSFVLAFFLGIMIALMGFSRIYLSVHHPSDVAGGLVLGSLAGYLAWRFAQWPLYWRRPGRT